MIVTESGKTLYNYDDVASLMGVCTSTVQKYVRGLGMALLPVSGKLHFEESQVVQVVEARKARVETRGRKKGTSSKSRR